MACDLNAGNLELGRAAAAPARRRMLSGKFSAARFRHALGVWYSTRGIWWLTSAVLHALVIAAGLSLMRSFARQELQSAAPFFHGSVCTIIADRPDCCFWFPPKEEPDEPLDAAAQEPDQGGNGTEEPPAGEGSQRSIRRGDFGTQSSIASAGSGPRTLPARLADVSSGLFSGGLFSGGTALNVAGGGAGGGRRAVAGGVRKARNLDEAVGGITRSLYARLAEDDVLVVYLIDESISFAEDRPAIADKIEPFARDLEARDKNGRHRLTSALLGFGGGRYGVGGVAELVPPTRFSSQIAAAIRNCPVDKSGSEEVLTAVQFAIGRYGKSWKNMLIVIWTDESGDDVCELDRTLALCKKSHATVLVVGPTAVFGSVQGTHAWVDKQSGFAFRLPVTRGPDAWPGKMHLPYWHASPLPAWSQDGAQAAEGMPWYGGPNREGLLSGFSPWGLTRLALQTGGSYTRWDREEDEARFDSSKLKRYAPSYESYADYLRSAKSTPLRIAVAAAADVPQSTTPPLAFCLRRSDRYPFPVEKIVMSPDEFRDYLPPWLKREAEACERRLEIDIEQALARFGENGMEDEYERELSPRWRAWYDLNRGRLLAMSVRYHEYVLTLESILKNRDSLKRDTNHVILHPSSNYRSGPEIEARATEARRLLDRCTTDHAGTPWAYLAQWELEHDFGLSIEEIALPMTEPTKSPPAPALDAKPAFTFPKL